MMVTLVIWQFFLLFWQRRERGTDFAEEGAVVWRKAGGPRAAEGRRGARPGGRQEAGCPRGEAGSGRRSVAFGSPAGHRKKASTKLFNLEKILNHGKDNRYRPGNY